MGVGRTYLHPDPHEHDKSVHRGEVSVTVLVRKSTALYAMRENLRSQQSFIEHCYYMHVTVSCTLFNGSEGKTAQ